MALSRLDLSLKKEMLLRHEAGDFNKAAYLKECLYLA